MALALLAPLAFLLARFPQSPDGAEMVVTALNGGVLHPSGMPLQAWINWLAVKVPLEPGCMLSWVSWLGAVGTVAMILLILRRLGVRPRESALAVVAYAYVPVVAMMAVIPEKYTWLSFTQMLFVYLLVRMHSADTGVPVNKDLVPKRGEWLCLAAALALALSQHSANVILVPVFLYVLLRQCWMRRPGAGLNLILACGLAAGITFGFYASMLLMRSSQAWPDWGQLESIEDVVNHAIRVDYGVTQLFHQDSGGERVSAFVLLAKSMAGWNLAFLFVFLGLFAMVKSRQGRFVWGLLLMVLLPGLGVLTKTAMPAADFGTAMGYQERYPLLVWPLLAVFWGVGLSWLLQRVPRYEKALFGVAAVLVGISAVEGWRSQRYANNNLVEVWRQQADYEMDDFTTFWTSSDFTGFYGVPRKGGVVFPLKNLIGLKWYHEKVLPVMSPALARILNEKHPDSPPPLFRQAIGEGFKIVLTEPTQFLQHQDIMALAEQTGVLWNFSSSNNALYTKQLIANTLNLCRLLPTVWKGVPENGMYFLWEFLNSFKFSFLSAADYLQAQMQLPPAQAARDVAAVLVPGRTPEDWRERCQAYSSAMGLK